MVKKNKIKIFKPNDKNSSSNIFVKDGISAGFPSPEIGRASCRERV